MSWKQFFLGILIGIWFSLVYYILLGAGNIFERAPLAAFGAVITKLVVGIVLIARPPRRWMGLGIGLITSVPVAILIFFGLCMAALSGLR